MGGQRGRRAAGGGASGGGGAAVEPMDYGSNEFAAMLLGYGKSPKQRCEDHYGAGLSIHSPEALQGHKLDIEAGGWCTDDGDRAYGIDGAYSFHKHGVDLPGQKLEASGPSAPVQLGWMGDHFAAGAQANYGEASIESTDDFDAARDDDDSFRYGVSAGGGAAARVHYSDKDLDGHPEYGLGFDYGPVSMDYKTETPVRDAVLFGLLGPVNALNWMFGDSILESFGVGGGVESAAAADLSEVMSSSESIGPATATARETVPPLPAAPALPEGSVFARPSPASFLDAHPGSVFDRR